MASYLKWCFLLENLNSNGPCMLFVLGARKYSSFAHLINKSPYLLLDVKEKRWNLESNSAVVWRKVLLVFFIIFELGPYSEPLWIVLPSESIRCGVKAFFHPKNWLWSLGPKKREKSQRCFIFGLEKGPDGVDFSKCGSFLVWRKVLLVQTRAP